jgi:predicted kinase
VKTKLVVLRGNAGSGKSSTARELCRRLGRGVAWVEQDYLRRIILREHDVPGGLNIGLIDQTVRYALDNGYDVILEGILAAARYEPMLAGLARDHAGPTSHYYFDISLEETLRRHATRPLAQKVTPEMIRDWYIPHDVLGFTTEAVIPESSSLEDTTQRIMTELNWTTGAPVAHTRE